MSKEKGFLPYGPTSMRNRRVDLTLQNPSSPRQSRETHTLSPPPPDTDILRAQSCPVDAEDGLANVETIDLVDVDDLQVQQLIRAQRNDEHRDGGSQNRLAGMTCVICMEEPTDLSILPCGHPFCDMCVRQYFRTSGPTGASGKCPVCRKRVATRSIIPLEIKVKSR